MTDFTDADLAEARRIADAYLGNPAFRVSRAGLAQDIAAALARVRRETGPLEQAVINAAMTRWKKEKLGWGYGARDAYAFEQACRELAENPRQRRAP